MDYSVWLSSELQQRSYDGKTQKGLATHMGVHFTIVNKMALGKREIKASELEAIAAYLGCPVPGTVPISLPIDCVGRIATGVWYEGKSMQSVTTSRVAPVLDPNHPVAEQSAYEVDGIAGISHVIAVESAPQKTGNLLVVRRLREGLKSLTLARMTGGKLVSVYPNIGVIEGKVIAVVIETRNRF